MSQPGSEHDLLLAASCITPFGEDGCAATKAHCAVS